VKREVRSCADRCGSQTEPIDLKIRHAGTAISPLDYPHSRDSYPAMVDMSCLFSLRTDQLGSLPKVFCPWIETFKFGRNRSRWQVHYVSVTSKTPHVIPLWVQLVCSTHGRVVSHWFFLLPAYRNTPREPPHNSALEFPSSEQISLWNKQLLYAFCLRRGLL
jgi:hypothetical protein